MFIKNQCQQKLTSANHGERWRKTRSRHSTLLTSVTQVRLLTLQRWAPPSRRHSTSLAQTEPCSPSSTPLIFKIFKVVTDCVGNVFRSCSLPMKNEIPHNQHKLVLIYKIIVWHICVEDRNTPCRVKLLLIFDYMRNNGICDALLRGPSGDACMGHTTEIMIYTLICWLPPIKACHTVIVVASGIYAIPGGGGYSGWWMPRPACVQNNFSRDKLVPRIGD